MKSIFLLCSVLGAVSHASECQADEHSLLQARRLVRTAETMGSKDSKDTLKNMRDVAESLMDDSDNTMSPDEVNEALDAANELLAELSPVIHQQIENAQQQIDDAASAVQVCHAQSVAEMRSSLRESTGQRAAAVENCHNTLDQLQTAETRQCNIAEDCLCDEARVRTTDQEPLCVAITETYEVAFCEHHHVCTIFHQCHSQEAEVFQHLRADVEAEMALAVQEYIAVEQSRCLTGLIMEAMTPPRTPISHAALIACDDVDVSALNINFPDLPLEPAACPAHSHGDPQCEGAPPPFPELVIIRNAHSDRRLYAQSDQAHENGVGADNGVTTFDDQKWIIGDAGNGAYTVTNSHSGRRLFAQSNRVHEDGVGASNGVTVFADQKWYIEATGEGAYVFRNYHSNRRLFAQSDKAGEDGVGASNGVTVFADQTWYIEAA